MRKFHTIQVVHQSFNILILIAGVACLPQQQDALPVSRILSVRIGQSSVCLPCPAVSPYGVDRVSSIFWILQGAHVVISIGANFDHGKYTFMPLTGELEIKNVSLEDAGVYRCIVEFPLQSKASNPSGQRGGELVSAAVELIVGHSYVNLWDEGYMENIIRALLAAGAAILVLTLSCIVYNFRWKDLPASKLSPNESFPSQSRDNVEQCSSQNLKSSIEQKPHGTDNLEETHLEEKNLQRICPTKIFVIPEASFVDAGRTQKSILNDCRRNSSHSTSTMMMIGNYDDSLSHSRSTLSPPPPPISPKESPSPFNFKTCSPNTKYPGEESPVNKSVSVVSPESESSVMTIDSDSGPITVIRIK